LAVGSVPALPSASASEPLRTTNALPRAVAGDVVDAQSPALYRLPRVSTFAPPPTKPSVVQQLPAVAPSPPQSAGSIPARQRTEMDSQAVKIQRGVNRRTVEIEAAPALQIAQPKVEDVPRFDMPTFKLPAATAPTPAMAAPYAPTTTELTPQLIPAVQRGYAMAQRGAMYAARAEFVQVLRRIAQAKDAANNSDNHSQALAAGLRAIDEAEDFVPDGVQLEAELDVRIVASSHRTPVLGDCPADASPHEAVALYHRYAQDQLVAAVGGEQAGSMVLHGMGKISATLAQRASGDPAMKRSAVTMYSAALATCPSNHLAANELGVLLVRDGRADEAARLFERTIDIAPSATAYHNLAVAQGKLGFHREAAANEEEAQRLAALERASGAVSRRAGVEWVSPDEMAGVAQPALTRTGHVPPKSLWRKTVDMARSLPMPGASKTR
jgi:tetratricopeptide (TPR) repeat protein